MQNSYCLLGLVSVNILCLDQFFKEVLTGSCFCEGEISSERYRYQWGVPKKGNIILLTIWCILRWYIVTFDKTKQLWAYPMCKTNLQHPLFMSVTLTFWFSRPFWALTSDLASVVALQLQHFVCQTFWYIEIRNPSTNKKVIPQNVKWYRFPKGLLC